MPATSAIIGGSTAYRWLQSGAMRQAGEVSVDTPYGRVDHLRRIVVADGMEAWFLSRHGQAGYEISAPFVNYRANIYALKELGVERVAAWSGPGSLDPRRFRPGDWVLPADILDETRQRPGTFFVNRGWGFIRSGEPFCPVIREAFRQGLASLGRPLPEDAVYVCTEGPRLETAAEIRKYARQGGDLVGMTLAPEAFLARELEMCYAPLCYVTNFAEGTVKRPGRPGELFGGMLDPDERRAVERSVADFPAVITRTLAQLHFMPRDCQCGHAMLRYRREGILGEDWHGWIGDVPAGGAAPS